MARKHALCIGINDYPGTGSDLYGCVNDANDWADALERRGFACERLLDAAATGDAIRSGMAALARTGTRGDIVVIVFAGHGSVVPDLDGDEADGNDECWCPHDVASNGVITDDELNAVYARRQDGVRWVLISDSCNSGTMSRRSRLDIATADLAAAMPRSRFLPPNCFLSADRVATASMAAVARGHVARINASPPGRRGALLLAGCQEDQESMDAWFGGRPNGAFTWAALRTLEELPPEADYEAWFAAIGDYLPSSRYPQEPNLYDIANRRKKWRVLAAENENPARPKAPRPAPQSREDALSVGRALGAEALGQASRKRDRARARRRPVIAEGDSWFSIPIFADLLDELEDSHGFDITSVAHHGDTLESMAFAFAQRNGFTRQFLKMLDRDTPPEAVLLSGGGNDIAGEQFRLLINPARGLHRGLNAAILDELVHVRLREAYATLIGAIGFLARERIGHEIPIFLHGYAHAVPDGRGFGWINIAGPWLQPAFRAQGYEELDETREMVAAIIDAFNAMLASLAGSPGMAHVHYMNFVDVMPTEGDHRRWWNDELHPTDRGFRLLAERLAARVEAVLGGG
ncbi:hypothetical protein LNKW23_15920 [Paralimibaculum aggregatum]|uniref:Peptidase C14 caspase domain-containing protein n=1 Tax=Paralimibaculum aggregatum TaxID=3036245 RepID=A0ABQ6LP28_9RHOB|nr:caspase family protein [Limibaculum sp. NKW23]GMG82379.1 hypothetical protein LNKW23_15920 [Limibaculum sp. NKW23]